jgi:hypothetical protein
MKLDRQRLAKSLCRPGGSFGSNQHEQQEKDIYIQNGRPRPEPVSWAYKFFPS